MGKKPFSAKAKREQLRQKRLASTAASAGPTPNTLSHTQPTASNNTLSTNTNAPNAAPASASPRRSRAARGGPSNSHSHKYRLVFAEDTDAARKRQRAQAHVPVSLFTDVPTLLQRRTMSVPAVRPYPNPAFAMPRRPEWSYRDTVNVLDKRELAAFREWLDRVQRPADPLAAYFEGNLETWRQLWRVIERSDVLVLVADIRFPALHFVPDLYHYVTEECNKGMVLALNKCDLVPGDVLIAWKNYFEKHYPELAIAMFSSFPDAKLAPSKDNSELLSKRERRMARSKLSAWGADQLLAAIETLSLDSRKKAYLGEWRLKLEEEAHNSSDDEEASNTDLLDGINYISTHRFAQKSKSSNGAAHNLIPLENKADIPREYDVSHAKSKVQRKKRRRAKNANETREVPQKLESFAKGKSASSSDDRHAAFSSEYNGDEDEERRTTTNDGDFSDTESAPSEVRYELDEDDDAAREDMVTIGIVGHPNAGKSSLINGVFRKKVVSTSRTPGHTKHLQTIFLSDSVRLCDCPGLVFPGLAPRELQILAGMYPIAQVREPYAAVKYLADRVPLANILNLDTEIERLEDHHEEPGYISSTGWTAWKICEAWALKRGFRTAKAARLDVFRAANNILRLALDGRIVLATIPDEYEPDTGGQSEVSHMVTLGVASSVNTRTPETRNKITSATSETEENETDGESEREDSEEDEVDDGHVDVPTFTSNAFSLLQEEF